MGLFRGKSTHLFGVILLERHESTYESAPVTIARSLEFRDALLNSRWLLVVGGLLGGGWVCAGGDGDGVRKGGTPSARAGGTAATRGGMPVRVG